MKISKTLYVTNRKDWRSWLKKNHATEMEVWLVYYKKHTGKLRIPYDDAVEEALCFGWIDSIVKRIDDATYAQKFTPRKTHSKWSELNRRRAAKLIREGRMTESGLRKVDHPLTETGNTLENLKQKRKERELVIPIFLQRALKTNKQAWENFKKLAPSYRRNYIGWLNATKTEETRNRRLKEAIALLSKNKKLGMK